MKNDKVFKNIEDCLNEFYTAFITPDEKINTLSLVEKILSNILNNEEEKYRRLNTSNEKLFLNLWRYKGSEELFK